MEFELADGVYLPKMPRVDDDLALKPKYCSRYARLSSLELLIGKSNDDCKLWIPANAWNYRYENRVAWSRGVDGELNPKKLRRGQILGIKRKFSIFNEKRDYRGNIVRNTHLALFIGKSVAFGRMNYWIAHNVDGEVFREDLNEFLYDSGSYVTDVFNPRDESVLDRCEAV